jgi:hypothetical protein
MQGLGKRKLKTHGVECHFRDTHVCPYAGTCNGHGVSTNSDGVSSLLTNFSIKISSNYFSNTSILSHELQGSHLSWVKGVGSFPIYILFADTSAQIVVQ